MTILFDCPPLPERPLYVLQGKENCFYAVKSVARNLLFQGCNDVIFNNLYNIRHDEHTNDSYIDSQIILPCLINGVPTESWSHIFIFINSPDVPAKLCRNHHGNTWYECGIYNMKEAVKMFVDKSMLIFKEMEKQ